MEQYANIKYDELERPKIPYNHTPIDYKDFQIACKTDSYHIKKVISRTNNTFALNIKKKLENYSPAMIQNMIMVLALKSAYYITEPQILTICDVFDIDYIKFHQILLEIKNKLEPRLSNRRILEERRNRAYYFRNKIRDEIEWKEGINSVSDSEDDYLEKCFLRNNNTWINLNNQLMNGILLIRPTTKLIAKVLGISTRQVTYYQTLAKKLGIDITKV